MNVSQVTAIDGVVGHSQGALLLLAYLSHHHHDETSTIIGADGEQQHHHHKIKQAYLLAPPVAGWDPSFAIVQQGLVFPFLHRFIPNKDIHLVMLSLRHILSRLCLAFPSICRFTVCLIAGCGRQSMLDPSKLGTTMTFYPAASSFKNIEHLFECERQSALVRRFGREDNYLVEDYSTIRNVSLHFYFGSQDRLVNKRRFSQGLDMFKHKKARENQTRAEEPEDDESIVKKYRIFEYGHADFVWGENARELIYEDIATSL
jgi:hypothetical protein